MSFQSLSLRLLCLALAISLDTASSSAQAVPIGAQVKTATYTSSAGYYLNSAGMNTVRFGIYYYTDFSVNGQDSTAWQQYDSLVQTLDATGTKFVMTAFIPSATITTQVNAQVNSSTTQAQKDLIVRQTVQSDLNTLVSLAVQRYGTRIAAVEIWNEPDNSTFWSSSLGTFTNAMTDVCNSVSTWPVSTVYGYAFTQLPHVSSTDNSASTQLYDSLSSANAVSCLTAVSAHFYTTTPEVLLTQFPYAGSALSKPISITEFGASSDPAIRTDAAQAQLVLRSMLSIFIAKPLYASIYEWKDTASVSSTQQQHYGMIDQNDAIKPAYTGISNLYSYYLPAVSTSGSCSSGLCSLTITQSPNIYTIYWRSDASGVKLSTILGNISVSEKQLSLTTAFTTVSASSVWITSTPIVVSN